MNNELMHYGVLGMKWGKRKGSSSSTKRKKVSDMSDDELKSSINRLRLEQDYKSLTSASKKKTKGKNLVKDVLETSIKSVGIAATTYLVGTAINSAMGTRVIKT